MTDSSFVRRVVELLAAEGVETWIFGGWAEELLGLAPPRPHRDLDLLYPSADFARLDALALEWVAEKRFDHKRAFVLDGALVEVLLVRSDAEGLFTDFSGLRHRWPRDVFASRGGMRVASARAVSGYRDAYERLKRPSARAAPRAAPGPRAATTP